MKTRILSGGQFRRHGWPWLGSWDLPFRNLRSPARTSHPTITVLVANYSQASPAILAAAEREAGRILGQAGLRASWIECSVGPSTISTQDPCQKAPEANGIRLRILPGPVLDKFQDSVFGFAIHPVLASVYYEFALRRARRDDAEFELPIILGCVMAHELGHLLLGSNSHSDRGIMLPRWEVESGAAADDGGVALHARAVKADAPGGASASRASEPGRPSAP